VPATRTTPTRQRRPARPRGGAAGARTRSAVTLASDTFDAFAAGSRRGAAEVPIEEQRPQRHRTRRGGPRTPIPLLPIITVVAGIAIAYVAQTAHLTQATYQATSLAAQQASLRQQDARLGEELDRLRSSARIDAAAQQLGMRPPARWAYVPSTSVTATLTVPSAPAPATPAPGGGDPVQRLVALLSGQFGPAEAEAAGR